MKLQRIKEKLAQILKEEIKMSVIKTDKNVLSYDGDELTVGMPVYILDENGERLAVEDGSYFTEEKDEIVVEDGKVKEIIEVAEVDGADEEPKPEDAPVEEPVEEEKLEEEPVEEPKETEPTEIEKIREEINELYKLVDSILDKIGETRDEADARFKKLEQMSAAAPAQEVIEGATDVKLSATSDKRAKRLAELSKDWRNI